MTAREKKLEGALKDIALYVLPTYTFNNDKYVKLDDAKYLRNIAKNALSIRDKD